VLQRPLTREAIVATILAIPERKDLPEPAIYKTEHLIEVIWLSWDSDRSVCVTVSRVNVLLSLRETGKPTATQALGPGQIPAIRCAIDWAFGEQSTKGGAPWA
jgi:hypothetical protein